MDVRRCERQPPSTQENDHAESRVERRSKRLGGAREWCGLVVAIAARGEEGPLRCLADGRLVCIAGPRGDELRPLVVVDEE